MKVIRIEHCSVCHYRDHKGGFGEISYIPCCDLHKRKELPYTINNASGGRATASIDITAPIPDWCPLEDLIK